MNVAQERDVIPSIARISRQGQNFSDLQSICIYFCHKNSAQSQQIVISLKSNIEIVGPFYYLLLWFCQGNKMLNRQANARPSCQHLYESPIFEEARSEEVRSG